MRNGTPESRPHMMLFIACFLPLRDKGNRVSDATTIHTTLCSREWLLLINRAIALEVLAV